MRSAARKDDPFISEFDMGITDHLLESMNKLEMVTTEDYELQKARITHENRPPSDLLLSELKHRVRQYGVWHKGMSREEMEFKLAYQDRRSTKLTRLREASDVAGFGFGNSRLTKIVGDTEKNKNVQSIMLEVNRSLYLNENANSRSKQYLKTKGVIQEYLKLLHENCNLF